MTDLSVGDSINVARHSGRTESGTVTALGDWQKSCAGSPMRWVTYRDASGTERTVADTPHRDNDISKAT